MTGTRVQIRTEQHSQAAALTTAVHLAARLTPILLACHQVCPRR